MSGEWASWCSSSSSCSTSAVGLLVGLTDVRRDTAAVVGLEAIRLRPLTDLRRVPVAALGLARGRLRAPGAAGVRRSEALGMKWDLIHWDECAIELHHGELRSASRRRRPRARFRGGSAHWPGEDRMRRGTRWTRCWSRERSTVRITADQGSGRRENGRGRHPPQERPRPSHGTNRVAVRTPYCAGGAFSVTPHRVTR